MKTTKLLPALVLLAFILALISCKKIDTILPDKKETANSPEEKFFNSHRTANPTERALIDYLKRVNAKDKFVEQTIKQIGFPQ